MDQIYLDKPEYQPAPAEPQRCATGSCKAIVTGRFKTCDRCRRASAVRMRELAYYREYNRRARAEAEADNNCNVCFKRPAPSTHKSCQHCRDKRQKAYQNRSPARIAKDRASRRRISQTRYARLMANRHSKAGRAAYERFRAQENAARRIRMEAKARAQKNRSLVSVELERMGASPEMISRWKRKEERGNAR